MPLEQNGSFAFGAIAGLSFQTGFGVQFAVAGRAIDLKNFGHENVINKGILKPDRGQNASSTTPPLYFEETEK
jgi:hypothetical protein